MLRILVFPVNILVVSSVSYEFAMIGFILKTAQREGKREDEGKGNGKRKRKWEGEKGKERRKEEGRKEERKRRNVSYWANYNESEVRKIQALISILKVFNNISVFLKNPVLLFISLLSPM